MNPELIIAAGKEIAGVINSIYKDKNLRQLSVFFKFLQHYEEEKTRPDMDFDAVLHMKMTKQIFIETVLNEIKK